MSVFRGCLCSSPGLCQQVMPVFSCLCSYIICSPLWSHFWPFMPVFVDYAARGMAIFRYFLLLSIILRSMHVQQYACLVFVVVHTKCMVFDFGKYIQQFCIIYISLYILYRGGFLLATAPALAVVWWWSWVSAVLIRHASPL